MSSFRPSGRPVQKGLCGFRLGFRPLDFGINCSSPYPLAGNRVAQRTWRYHETLTRNAKFVMLNRGSPPGSCSLAETTRRPRESGSEHNPLILARPEGLEPSTHSLEAAGFSCVFNGGWHNGSDIVGCWQMVAK